MRSGAPTLFTADLDAPARSAADRARLLRALPFAIALHVLVLGTALLLHPTGALSPGVTGTREALTLRLLSAPVLEARAPAPPAVRARAQPRRSARRAGPGHVPEGPAPPLQPAPLAQPAEAEAPVVTGAVVGAVVAAALLSAEQRAQSLDEYLLALERSRFQHVPYPHQAAADGITGMVTVRLTIGAHGELLAMERVGRCPHPVLCEGAEEAVRNALPFLPPPAELGRPLTFELPFRFRLY